MKRKNIIVLISSMVFSCMVFSIVIALATIHRMSSRHTVEFMEELSNNIYGSIRGELLRTIDVAETVAHDSLLINLIESEGTVEQEVINRKMAEYTSELSDIFSYLWVSIISDETGAYYLNDGLYRYIDPENNPEDAWYTEVRSMTEDYRVSLGVDNDSTDKWTMFIDSRICDSEGKFIGICGIALQVEDLQHFLMEYEERYGIEILFVNRDGEIQLRSGDFDDNAYAGVNFAVEDEGDTVSVHQIGIRRDYTITKYMEELQWYMIINNVNPYNYSTDYILVAGNIAAYALFLGIAVFGIRYMVRREGSLYDYSYRDSMTGLYNRRAYDEEVNDLRERNFPEGLAIASFDVNGLKQVNDVLGHSFGDRLILASARVISGLFKEYGLIYRTGGDEFVAILYKPIPGVDELQEKLETATDNWNGEPDGALHISFGYVEAKDYPDISIDQLIFLADEEMYRKKEEFYQKTNTRREKSGQ